MDPKDEGDRTTSQKEILRQKILTKRKDLGEEDTRPVKQIKHVLTPEEIEKREKRKAQNRKAATKFRNKKKNILDANQQERLDLIRANAELQCQIGELSTEVDKLKEMMDKHLESGCSLISIHIQDHQESNPIATSTMVFTDISDPTELYLNLEKSDPSPARPVLNTDTTGLISETTGLIPETTGLIPETTGLIPETTGLIPETLGINPETTLSQTLIDEIGYLLSDFNPNDLDMSTYNMNTQPQKVNDFKMPIASLHHDLFQHSVNCSPDNEFDMSITTQSDQLSMFQNAQSHVSPVSEEFEDHLDPWLPNDESLEQPSFTNL
ncbi:hypothetical protein LOTGIDRAFT_236585 [Lottia gigantea]|uniref:BZIP domain-containing protein n=1 Tax=Lottia gigantea TaxID=225164 RepID=V3ZLX4_LOTGI|nr:hypothetical protein LOTGIDRAFT_236585 [Lottia gigantea]ESO83415.1 hypothetical protein LOTGIDRAFT_236585 [Lottia gigantea]